MTFHAKMALPGLQRYPQKLSFDLEINAFVPLNYLFSFRVLCESDSFVSNGETKKNDGSLTFLWIRLRFKG